MEPIKISGTNIIESYGDLDITSERLTALQQAGMKIALWVGIIGSVIIMLLVWQWMRTSPDMPKLPINQEDAKQVAGIKTFLDNFKMASDMAIDGPAKLFDMIIVKVLYPLLTLVLGYIFGTRITKSGE